MGKHSAPSRTRENIIKLGGAALAATTLPLATAGTASADVPTEILEVIAHCESGNKNVNHNSRLSGVKSTASGYLQILDSTWRAFGGTEFASRAINASRSEQFIVGQRILKGQGIGAWGPSRSCWGSKVGKAKTVSAPTPNKTPQTFKASVAPKLKLKSAPKPTQKTIAQKVAASYTIKRGDTLLKIAQRNHTTWRALYKLNRDTVKNPNMIYTGHTLRLR